MGILRTDVIAHSQLTSANASVAFDGGAGANGSTGLRTADGDYGYALGNSSESITIECWIYPTSVSQTFDAIFATNTYGVSGTGLILYNNNDGLYMSGTGMASDYAEYGLLEANTWYHIAFVKEKSQVRLYLDGVCKAYRETTSDFADDQLCIGCSNYGSGFPTYSFAGNISNFRIVKRALYKENFTPSKFKLKNIPGTTLLCCQDSSDDTTAAVGSISAGGSPTPGGLGPDLKEDNTDTGVVFEDNTKFDTLSYMVPPGGTTAESNRGRALIMGGGSSPGSTNQSAIQHFNIQSLGTTQYFGALTVARRALQSVGSSTRGVALGGIIHPTVSDVIDYVTFATQSNATDFGNLTSSGYAGASASNNTRGIWAGGYRPNNSAVVNSIDYITIATAGNAADFGDLTAPQRANAGGSNTTRAVFAGGAYPAVVDTIEYVTIASTGDATDFGNLTDARDYPGGGGSSPTRTCFAGGRDPSNTNIIDYITTATTGNAIDFGDTVTAGIKHGLVSNGSRGVICSDASITNAMEYITFATTGNAVDFGDQVSSSAAPVVYSVGACSDSHGGIS